jgi:hypothetical protein
MGNGAIAPLLLTSADVSRYDENVISLQYFNFRTNAL